MFSPVLYINVICVSRQSSDSSLKLSTARLIDDVCVRRYGVIVLSEAKKLN